jgi:hypothetical protein
VANDRTDNGMSIWELAQIGAVAVQEWRDRIAAMDAERQEAFAESEQAEEDLDTYRQAAYLFRDEIWRNHSQLAHGFTQELCPNALCMTARQFDIDRKGDKAI